MPNCARIFRRGAGRLQACFAWALLMCAQHPAVGQVCRADISPPGGNGTVNVNDLLAVINNWGPCALPCRPHCASDIAPSPSGDCSVNVNDLLVVINSWGSCPPSPAGTWINAPVPQYTCAFGLISLNVTQWVFSVNGPNMSVAGAPVNMSGPAVPCVAGQTFSVSASIPGSCTETYALSGTFSSATQFSGTFTAIFTPSMTGNCFDCNNRVFNLTATRNP